MPGLYEGVCSVGPHKPRASGSVPKALEAGGFLESAIDPCGFLESVNRAYRLIKEAEAALNASPPTITKEEALEIEREAQNLLRRASATLDMSNVPRALRQDTGMAAVLQLKEVLDRSCFALGLRSERADCGRCSRAGQLHFEGGAEGLRWRLPNTEIRYRRGH